MIIILGMSCPHQKSPPHGFFTDYPSYEIGSSYKVACDSGYQLTSGDGVRHCQTDNGQITCGMAEGYWTGDEPICTGRTVDIIE